MLVPVQGTLQQAAERELMMEGTAVEKSELQFVPLGRGLSGHWRLGSCYVLASYSELFAWNPVYNMPSSKCNLFTDLYWFIMIVSANESFYWWYAYLYSVENLSDL